MDQKTINLPTRKQVEGYWEQYCTPLHIRAHMRKVSVVALWIAKKLHQVGEPVILNLVDRAALLHDTVRVTEWSTLSFEYFPSTPSKGDITVWEAQRKQYPPHMSHAEVNYHIFKAQYPEMAQVIRMHSVNTVSLCSTWEEKIVQYADRRVAHSTVVSIDERFEEARGRWGDIPQKYIDATKQLEQEICTRINTDPAMILYQDATDTTTQPTTHSSSRSVKKYWRGYTQF